MAVIAFEPVAGRLDAQPAGRLSAQRGGIGQRQRASRLYNLANIIIRV